MESRETSSITLFANKRAIPSPSRTFGRKPGRHRAAGNPTEHAIGKEEEAILWRSLEQIPETYREPLVLFYREHQSLERVAAILELSEETARQRLSRGRKLLQERVVAFVEGAWNKPRLARLFTLAFWQHCRAVIFAKAATLGAAAKAGTLAKGSGLVGYFRQVFGANVPVRWNVGGLSPDEKSRAAGRR